MSNPKRRRRMHGSDERDETEPKPGQTNRRKDDADVKAPGSGVAAKPLGSREIRIVSAGQPNEPNPRGRRAEPTRYDAMPIAGHQRLPGYDTPPPGRESHARDDGIRSPDPTEESEAARRRRPRHDDET